MAQTLSQIRAMLDERGLAPKKSLGQNFLVDQNLLGKLVDASGAAAGDLVLEVGPGTGTLTRTLLERGAEVVACEMDAGLCALLRETLGVEYAGRFTLIEGDCLASKRAVNPALADALGDRAFTLVANLPYQAATPLILALLTGHERCASMHVTIQKEVADRLIAGPGTKTYGSIGVVAQALADVERIATLPPECFWPRPDVTSAMISITRRDEPLVPGGPDAWARFAAIVQVLFASRRKQLSAAIKRAAPRPVDLPEGVLANARVESLPVERVVALARAVADAGGGGVAGENVRL